MNDYIQANTDGRLHDAAEPSISPLNRGFLYGDAIYEVWRTYNGILFAWQEHWDRLETSARALHLTLPITQIELLTQIRHTTAAFFAHTGTRPELYIRVQVTRGAGAIGLNTALADQPSYVILVQTLKESAPEKQRVGLRLSLASALHRNHPLTLNPAWKTGNYLNNILCLREAIARGADEVLMTNLAGEITEAAVSNVFFVRDGQLFTPPLGAGILAGITRRIVLEKAAPLAGVTATEEALGVEDLRLFQECFLTSTTKGITPVASIDSRDYTVGEHTVTQRLAAALAGYVHRYVATHANLKL